MINRQVMAYQKTEVDTASKLKLVVMLYDGAIRFLNESKKRIDSGDIAGRGLYISKAQRIVGELQETLNMNQGGNIAVDLKRLYDFVLQSLTKANIKGDKIAIDQALSVLENLRSAWGEVMQNAQATTAAERQTPTMPRLAMRL